MLNLFRESILGVHHGLMHARAAIDEAMFFNQIKRAPFRRCMPCKPYDGWKFFVLGDAVTRTVVNFFWDDGITLNAKICKNNPCKFGGAIVQRLLADVETLTSRIALDRYFPNPALCAWIVARGGDVTAMWDPRKGPFPVWLKLLSKKPTKKCPKGTFRSASALDGRLWAFSFMDNAACYCLDTAEGGVFTDLMRMQKKGTKRYGEKIAVKGPKCNEYYQGTMGVIDG